MKLSTRSRYGTRLILDIAEHGTNGPVKLEEIARRQKISLEYLEQIILPLKRANYIRTFRGIKGGCLLNKDPKDITVGEVVSLLEGRTCLAPCAESASCRRANYCLTRSLWVETSEVVFEHLNRITFSDLLAGRNGPSRCNRGQLNAAGCGAGPVA